MPRRPITAITILLGAAVLSGTSAAETQTPAQRARENLDQLLTGKKQLRDLSADERAELAAAEALAQAEAARASVAERCRADELKRLGKRPTRLDWRIINLKCRQP